MGLSWLCCASADAGNGGEQAEASFQGFQFRAKALGGSVGDGTASASASAFCVADSKS